MGPMCAPCQQACCPFQPTVSPQIFLLHLVDHLRTGNMAYIQRLACQSASGSSGHAKRSCGLGCQQP